MPGEPLTSQPLWSEAVPVLIGSAATLFGLWINSRVTNRGQLLDTSLRRDERELKDREFTLNSFRELIAEQRKELDELRNRVESQETELAALQNTLRTERAAARAREFQWLQEYAELNRKYHELLTRVNQGQVTKDGV